MYLQQLKSGKLLVENTIKTIESYLGPDDPKMKFVRESAPICGEIALPDRCDGSAAIYQCAQDQAIKHGIKLEEVV